MSSEYEFWLCDDSGRKIILLDEFAYCNYARTTRGFGTVQIGFPLEKYKTAIPNLFQPDWRIDIWRSPGYGFPKRRDASFFLRKFLIYERKTDNLRILEYMGRSPSDLLRRFSGQDSAQTVTDNIDDIMKDFAGRVKSHWDGNVNTIGEFSVEADTGLGPSITYEYGIGVALDFIKELHDISLTLNLQTPATNRKIFFDVLEVDSGDGFNFLFKTFADRRGQDKTDGLVFSPENGNLSEPIYYEDYFNYASDGVAINPGGSTATSQSPVSLSKWEEIYAVELTGSAGPNAVQAVADRILSDHAPDKSFSAEFLNTPGSSDQPRSLYGVDWDLGDTVPIQFAGKSLQADIAIVYVALKDDGTEKITGRTKIGEA